MMFWEEQFMASRKYESARQMFAEKLFKAYPTLGEMPDEVFAKIADYDPTATQKTDKSQYVYLEWICSRVLRETPREQDLYKIREDLKTYASLARLDKKKASQPEIVFYRPFVNAEIGQYSIASLAERILAIGDLKDRKKSTAMLDEERAQAESKTRILYDGPEGRIVSPMTMEASQYWGKGTKWCISATKSDNLFKRYHDGGKQPIIMFLPKGTREKFAFNEYDWSSARNMLDEGIVDPLQKTKKYESPSVAVLGDFLATALTSSNLNLADIKNNRHLVRAFQLFVLWNPQVYQHVANKVTDEELPDILQLRELLPFCESFISAEKSAKLDDDLEDKQTLVRRFISLDSVITPFITHPAYARYSKPLAAALENVEAADIIGRITDDMLVPPTTPFQTLQDYIDDFRAKYQRIKNIEDIGSDHFGDMVSERADESIITYMKAIPPAFWNDEQFALDFITSGYIWGTNYIDAFPDAYNHPKVLEHLLSEMDIDLLSGAMKELDFKAAWRGKINGVPMIEIAVNMLDTFKRPRIDDMTAALLLYEAIGDTEGLDLSPLVRKVEALYPDGFEDTDEVDYATVHMGACDFTAILEKTIQKRPELFEDVAPEKQTMQMAIAAVKHDPGSLADMAAHLFKGDIRPPELTAAFNKLPPDSMERGAVADYFEEPKGP
jgi:hypothetical protein